MKLFKDHHKSRFRFRGKDLVGRRFGKLVVVKRLGCDRHNNFRWKCRCDCGGVAFPVRGSLTAGLSKTCGCSRSTSNTVTARWGGMSISHAKEYSAWKNMISRCYRDTDISFINYGARGISVCSRWRKSFKAFFEDMGVSPKHHSLDRKNNDKNYCPSNCRWATKRQQMKNRRASRLIRFRGITRTVTEWSAITGLSVACIRGRLAGLWSVKDALTLPLNTKITFHRRRRNA